MPAPNAPQSGKVDAEELLKLFPGALGPWKLQELGKPLPPKVPAPQRLVRAVYVQDRQSAEISVRAGAPKSDGKGKGKGARDVYREAPPQRPDTMVVITLGNGLSIAATSATADAASLEALIRSIDLDRAESLKPAKR
jgi:hypothetical protein